MMPLASQNSGGRSSNLSPLAPPFTLDKPYHKQHNSNPPMNFTEPYGPRFDRPRPAWSPSVNPSYGPNFTEKSSKDDKFSPLDVHGFTVSQPNNSSSSSTRLAPLNTASGIVGYDGFSYGQYSNSVPAPLVEAEPYYPPYVVADDRKMNARKEPSYDLLSNFGVAQLSGSSQVDDTRTVSGVKYTPQWNGLWNGLNDVEQGNWLDLGGNYSSKDHKHSEPSNGQQSLRKGSDAGGDRYNFLAGGDRYNRFDGFGGENNFGSTSIEDRKSFKEPNPGATTATCIRLSSFGSTSACNEMTRDPFLQHPPTSYGLYESPVVSRDKHTNNADSYVLDSTSTVRSSPANMNKRTFGGFPSPQYAVPSATMDAVSNAAMDKTEKSSDFIPYHPFGLNFHVSNYTGNTDSLFTGSSSTKLEDKINKKQVNDDSLDMLLKNKSMSTVPHLSAADCLKIKCDTADAFYSMEKFSDGPDIQNTAEDSPCWKGARFSPFEDSKMVIPDIVLEMSESCFNQNGEEEQQKNSPTGRDTTDDPNTIHVLGEVNETLSSKRSSNSKHVFREHDGSSSMMQGLHSTKLFGGDSFQPFDKKNGLDLGIGNDLSFLSYSGIVSSPKEFQALQSNSECSQVMPEEKLAPSVAETVVELKGKSPDAQSSNVLSCSPTNKAGDDELHSPSGNVAASMTDQPSGKDSNSKVDISVLVNTMKNLSEVLVSHCSNIHDPSTELDLAALKHIIGNLNSCLVKKADQATQTEKSQDPEQGTSCLEGTLHGQTVSKFPSASTDQHDLDYFGAWKTDILCSRNEDLSDSSFGKDNTEPARDAETIQAVKRVLDTNFPSEEMQREAVLYKNLWLEAEAALCATTVKSRFNRMKIEMEKKDYQQTEEEENVPVSKASDVNKVAQPPHEANDSKHGYQTDMESSVIARFRTLRSVVEDSKPTEAVACHQSSSLDTEAHQVPTFYPPPSSQISDFEALVMARFQTLKSRADNSDLVNTEDKKSPSKANFRPQSPDHSMEDSYFSAMANHIDDPETAFMSRFNILKARIEQSESQDTGTQELQAGQSNMATLTSFFSTENRYTTDRSGGSTSSNPVGNKPRKANGVRDELLEGWYDCSEPGWEHVTKEGFLNKQN